MFEKYSNTKFHGNPSKGKQSCSIRVKGRTVKHDEANIHSLEFCKCA